jgi:hypothetical protein
VPRLMKGLFRRNASFYTRLREGGRDRWISLGTDYQEACRKLREFRREGGSARGTAHCSGLRSEVAGELSTHGP